MNQIGTTLNLVTCITCTAILGIFSLPAFAGPTNSATPNGEGKTITQTFAHTPLAPVEQSQINSLLNMVRDGGLSEVSCRVLSVGPSGDQWLTIQIIDRDEQYQNGVCKSGTTVNEFPARVASGNPNYRWIGAWTKCIKGCDFFPNGQLKYGFAARSWLDLSPGRRAVSKNAAVTFDDAGNVVYVSEDEALADSQGIIQHATGADLKSDATRSHPNSLENCEITSRRTRRKTSHQPTPPTAFEYQHGLESGLGGGWT